MAMKLPEEDERSAIIQESQEPPMYGDDHQLNTQFENKSMSNKLHSMLNCLVVIWCSNN